NKVARQAVDLVTCSAIAHDSDATCKDFYPESKNKGDKPDQDRSECRAWRSIMREVHDYPKGRAFVFNDVQYVECQQAKTSSKYCNGFREAARAGDASKCKSLGRYESVCRALIGLDKSLCKAPTGKDIPQQTSAEMARDCAEEIDRVGVFANGLKAAADSGS